MGARRRRSTESRDERDYAWFPADESDGNRLSTLASMFVILALVLPIAAALGAPGLPSVLRPALTLASGCLSSEDRCEGNARAFDIGELGVGEIRTSDDGIAAAIDALGAVSVIDRDHERVLLDSRVIDRGISLGREARLDGVRSTESQPSGERSSLLEVIDTIPSRRTDLGADPFPIDRNAGDHPLDTPSVDSPPATPRTTEPTLTPVAVTRPIEVVTVSSPVRADRFDIGRADVRDLWIDPLNGSDSNDGRTRARAMKTLNAAWTRIPEAGPADGTPPPSGDQSPSGWRLLLAPGTYPAGTLPTSWLSRHGTRQQPIIITAADGPGTATIAGNINLEDVQSLYLIDLEIVGAQATSVSTLSCTRCDQILVRNVDIDAAGVSRNALEVTQSTRVWIEDSRFGGRTAANTPTISLVAVAHARLVDSTIVGSNGSCVELRGGTADVVADGNELRGCTHGGFIVGGTSSADQMIAPWWHYEASGIKIVNSLVRNVVGPAFAVHGGYNVEIAHNTSFEVGANSPLLEIGAGSRSCSTATAAARCQEIRDAGGWSTAGVDAVEAIPNRYVRVTNNVWFNPTVKVARALFAVSGGSIGSARTSRLGVPDSSAIDDHLEIRGNVVNATLADDRTAVEVIVGDGCAATNATCNRTQLVAENAINSLAIELVDPTGGDFHPTFGGALERAATYAVKPFSWDDAPDQTPSATIVLDTAVRFDRDDNPRFGRQSPGAY